MDLFSLACCSVQLENAAAFPHLSVEYDLPRIGMRTERPFVILENRMFFPCNPEQDAFRELFYRRICSGQEEFETRIMRLIARAACDLQKECPDIHCHISSGNARYVMEQLDKGLIDFGLLYAAVDPLRYNSIPIPLQDEWGVLMRRDAPLADRPFITPEDLMGQPLILSQQEETSHIISRWMNCDPARLNVAATYNLIFNASLLAEEGLGYTLSFDGLINTKDSPLCFRPLKPTLCAQACLVWKKYQIMPMAAEKFLHQLQEYLDEM